MSTSSTSCSSQIYTYARSENDYGNICAACNPYCSNGTCHILPSNATSKCDESLCPSK